MATNPTSRSGRSGVKESLLLERPFPLGRIVRALAFLIVAFLGGPWILGLLPDRISPPAVRVAFYVVFAVLLWFELRPDRLARRAQLHRMRRRRWARQAERRARRGVTPA